jgi:hypothetical protein
VWDAKGWTMLGEQVVNGNVDKDRIVVGRMEGKFTKLTVLVQDSDLEMIDFKILFADKTEYSPAVSQYFREGSRTRVIDLPPGDRVISSVDFKYRNLPGGGRARVQVWGWRVAGSTPQVEWDSKGWTLLGSREVDRKVDRDRIEVGRYEGKFSKLTMVVRDSDLELLDLSVKFARGPEWRPNVAQVFREGQRTRVIDFPGDERVIKFIDLKYKNTPGGGRAKVEIWAWRTDAPAAVAPTTPVPAAWSSQGWSMLGEKTVNGKRADKDTIVVGRQEGSFRRLTIVVLESDLELLDLKVRFARGPVFEPTVKHVFGEGTRSRVIDLPGDKRVIKTIEFAYKNLPGSGDAKVQVWAQ